MRVAIVKPKPIREPLPKPPFVVHLSSIDRWPLFLEEYEEELKPYRWASGNALSDFNVGEYRFFDRDFEVTTSNSLTPRCQNRKIMEY